MSTVIGIDLGTTFSLAAVVEGGRPRIIEERGERLLPSVVGWSPKGELLIGTPALNQYVLEPERTVRSIKRLMGSPEPLMVAGQRYTPQQISAYILRELKERAERALGQPVQRAVITVPAHFTDAARRATWEAGELAGLEVARIINEPTAAALAYGLDREDDQKVAVYDLGGGTFDVSIVELSQGVIEVRASQGDLRLGGDDFDQAVLDFVADGFEAEHGIDLRQERKALARLRRAAEQAKRTLSDFPYARVTEEFIARKGWRGALHLDVEIARSEFDDLIRPRLETTLGSVDRALRDAALRPRDLQKVLLVGGSTRIPLVRRLLAEHLRREPRADVHPDEAVALGAAVQGAIIAGEPIDAVLVDVAPYSLGIETLRFVLGHPLPDRYSVLIPRNVTIPCSKADSFYTVTPEQDRARVRVYQGEEDVASRNTLLGEFLFEGISPASPGETREVIVRFDYDVNGMVQVSALDRRSDRSEGIRVSTTRDQVIPVATATRPASNGRIEREIKAVLRRAERLMTRLRAEGATGPATELLELVGALEWARQQRDYDEARVLMEAISSLLYVQEG